MVTDNFVWILGKGSIDGNNEIRYSIRSVLKYHPDATVTIIGERPEWYKGSHYYIHDFNTPSQNKWCKTLKACELFDQFVQMDDDFYLLEPYKPNLYYDGLLIHRDFTPKSVYGEMVVASMAKNQNAKNYLLHTPLPVISELYPKDIGRESPRQTYCEQCDKFPELEMKDVKFSNRLNIKGLPFFSIDRNFKKAENKLKELYPTKSKYEK